MNDSDRQQIEWALTRLVHQFAHFIDHGRYRELADLFADDGEFDRVGEVLRGREAIYAAMQSRHTFLTRHAVFNLLFTRVDANEAEAIMYVANFVGHPGDGSATVNYAMAQPALIEFGDLYRRGADGWRIARRTAKLVIKPDSPASH